MMQTLKPTQLAELLAACIPAKQPVLVVGDPGIGKTQIVSQAAAKAGYDALLAHPSTWDPVDAGGFPAVALDRTRINKVPVGRIADALACTQPTVLFLDDLAHAPAAVHASLMQLVLARELDGQRLPECVTIVAASNERTKHTGTHSVIEPLKSRFVVVKLAPDHADWMRIAMQRGVAPEIVGFLAFKPGLLHAWEPRADMSVTPSPRAWECASRVLAMGLSKATQHAALCGVVGEGAAGELAAFVKIASTLVPPSVVFAAPKTAPLPTEPSAVWALIGALVHTVAENTASAFLTYLERMHGAGLAEYVAFAVKLFAAREDMAQSGIWGQIATSKMGKFILGINRI